MVTVPLSYMNMVLATPNANDSVIITGNSAYNSGLFPANRTVTLSPFYIAKYETTYELWYKVYQWAIGNGYTFANAGREGHDGTIGALPTELTIKYEPVTTISWRDAVVWCNAYSEMSGKEAVYYTDTSYNTVLKVSTNDSGTGTAADKAVMKEGAKGYRLPTEAEWEYAARGGGTPSITGSFVYTYAGSNTIGSVASYMSNSNATCPVGRRQANSLGLYDMSGNVTEWCWDWNGTISGETVIDPKGPGLGTDRVSRGGSWNYLASYCSVAYRYLTTPGHLLNSLGFRLVLCP
jgi:formylglycine-generating enzyme required for sulfatase activity